MVQGLFAPCRYVPSQLAVLSLLTANCRGLYRMRLSSIQDFSLKWGTLGTLFYSWKYPAASHLSSIAASSCQDSFPSKSSPSSNGVILSEAGDTFLAEQNVSWISLGLTQDTVISLRGAQLYHPSAVQAASVPFILDGDDVVIAAETGSGKTHAYLAPLVTKLLDAKQSDSKSNDAQVSGERRPTERKNFALVMCLNAMLCQQVMHMAMSLRNESGAPLLKVSVVSGGQGWPMSPPDIVVATPAALLNHLFAYDPKRKRRIAFVRDVKYVVFDEADMLLSGGFENQTMRLMNMFRLEEKQISKAQLVTKTTEMVDFRPWTEFPAVEPSPEDLIVDDFQDQENSSDTDIECGEAESIDKQDEERKNTKQTRQRDWLRSRKAYARSKQYIFAAATLPENGRKTPGAVLKRIFPFAKWVNGFFLHQRNPRLQEKWVEVDGSTQVQALLDALTDPVSTCGEDHVKKTLVFANSVEAANAIKDILKRAEIECSCYHREIPSEERMNILKAFQDEGGVLVCTDAAARGLDFRNVTHVIQAEFAKSAIDFLHRVGRTARAGQSGAVTSLYTKANRALVDAVRQAAAAGHSVEGAFSRKRSFRNRLKKAEVVSQLVE